MKSYREFKKLSEGKTFRRVKKSDKGWKARRDKERAALKEGDHNYTSDMTDAQHATHAKRDAIGALKAAHDHLAAGKHHDYLNAMQSHHMDMARYHATCAESGFVGQHTRADHARLADHHSEMVNHWGRAE